VLQRSEGDDGFTCGQAKPLRNQQALPICAAQMLHRTRSVAMIAAIERILDALFAPLAHELARMPPSAFRHLLAGL